MGEDVVTTDVDTLIELVKQRKRISFEEAAKKLGVGVNVIETWVSFLEEEGVIAVDYKFTTPFLVYPEGEKEKKSTASLNDNLGELDELLNIAHKHIENGEYDLAKQLYPKIVRGIGNAHERAKAEAPSVSAEDKERVSSNFNRIKMLLDKALLLTEEGEFEKAKEVYIELYKEIKIIFSLLRKVYLQVKELSNTPPEEKGAPLSLSTDSSIAEMLKQAYDAMKEGDLDRANTIYKKIEAYYNHLPVDFSEKKKEVKEDLIKLSKDIAINTDEIFSKKARTIVKRINNLYSAFSSLLIKKDLDRARKAYSQMVNLSKNIPPGFVNEKSIIEGKVADAEEKLLELKSSLFHSKVEANTLSIHQLISDMKREVDSGNVKKAFELYTEIRKKFEELPDGFFEEKAKLEDDISKAYSYLLLSSEKKAREEFKVYENQLNSLLKAANIHIRDANLSKVVAIYHQMKDIFKRVPTVLVEERIKWQERILNVYKQAVAMRDSFLTQELSVKSEQIRGLIANAQEYEKKGLLDLANEAIVEAFSVYSALPSGFLDKKTQLHQKILLVLRDLTLKEDTKFLENEKASTKKVYNEILKLVIKVHQNIQQERFNLVTPGYEGITKLMEELPYGFVRKNLRLLQEVNIIKMESDIIALSNEIERMIASKEYRSLEGVIGHLKKIFKEASEKSIGDKLLFDFYRRKIIAFSNILDIYKGHGPKALNKKSETPPLIHHSTKEEKDKEERDRKEKDDLLVKQVNSLISEGRLKEAVHLIKNAKVDDKNKERVYALLSSLKKALGVMKKRGTHTTTNKSEEKRETESPVKKEKENRYVSAKQILAMKKIERAKSYIKRGKLKMAMEELKKINDLGVIIPEIDDTLLSLSKKIEHEKDNKNPA